MSQNHDIDEQVLQRNHYVDWDEILDSIPPSVTTKQQRLAYAYEFMRIPFSSGDNFAKFEKL
jgi:hypothetical protein